MEMVFVVAVIAGCLGAVITIVALWVTSESKPKKRK